MRSRFVHVNGTSTHYLYEGTGPSVLLVHGFGVGAETWCRTIDPLAEHFTVFAPDLLGQGFTDPIDLAGNPPHPAILEHLAGFVDTVGLETFSIVGSSFGALISSLLYLRDPGRVDKLVLVGTGSVFHAEDAVPQMVKGAMANSGRALENPTLDELRQRLGRLFFDSALVPEEALLSELTSLARPGVVEFWKQGVAGMLDNRARNYRVIDRLEEIRAQTLVVWGRQDPRGEHEAAVVAMPRLQNASMLTFEECGHFPYLEKPDEFNAEVIRFLSGGDSRKN